MNDFPMRREYKDIRKISLFIPWLIQYRELVCNDERFNRKSVFNSSINEFSVGKISINTLFGLFDAGLWIEKEPSRKNEWYVYRIYGQYCYLFDECGNVKRKLGISRKYLIQYLKFPYKVPFEHEEVNIHQLKKLYEQHSGTNIL